MIIEGSGSMLVGDEERLVERGTMIFVPPATRHAIETTAAGAVYVSATSRSFDPCVLGEAFLVDRVAGHRRGPQGLTVEKRKW